MVEDDLLDDLGALIDKAENYLALQKMGLPPLMAIDSLMQGITELRDGLKELCEKQMIHD